MPLITPLIRRLAAPAFVLGLALPMSAQTDPQAQAPAGRPQSAQPATGSSQGGSRQPDGNTGPRNFRGPELWWSETSPFSKQLGLTKEQSAKIEKVFRDTFPELDKLDKDLRFRENTLSDLIKDDAPESQIVMQIGRVERTRSDLNKSRQIMLLHMRQVLTAPQRARFEYIHAQWRQEADRAELDRQQRNLQNSQTRKPDDKAGDQRGRPKQ